MAPRQRGPTCRQASRVSSLYSSARMPCTHRKQRQARHGGAELAAERSTARTGLQLRRQENGASGFSRTRATRLTCAQACMPTHLDECVQAEERDEGDGGGRDLARGTGRRWGECPPIGCQQTRRSLMCLQQAPPARGCSRTHAGPGGRAGGSRPPFGNARTLGPGQSASGSLIAYVRYPW